MKLKLDLGSSDNMNVVFANSTLQSQRHTVFCITQRQWQDMNMPIEINVEVTRVED